MSEEQLEADEADTAEQRRGVPQDEEVPAVPPRDDVDPADAAEQQRVVPVDEDDYR